MVRPFDKLSANRTGKLSANRAGQAQGVDAQGKFLVVWGVGLCRIGGVVN